MLNYGIGGQERPMQLSESIVDIPQNKTLLIEKLTDDESIQPQIVEGLRNIQDVFDHFKPSKEVVFESEDGTSNVQELFFTGLQDFGFKGIIHQSPFLNQLNQEKNDLQKYVKLLQSSKTLKTVLESPEARASYLAGIEAMIQEIEQNGTK